MSDRLTFTFSAPAQFRDGRHGKLATLLIDPQARALAGAVISNHGSLIFVPTELITAAFPDGVHVNERWDSISGGGIPKGLQLSPGQHVRWEGASGPAGKLGGIIAHRESGALLALLLSRRMFGPLRRLPAGQIVSIDADDVLVDDNAPSLPRLPHYGDDCDILRDVIECLREERLLWPEDFMDVSVFVGDGVVSLAGNVRAPIVRWRVTGRVRRISGVVSLIDELIEDQQLEIAVAAALGRQLPGTGLQVRVSAWVGHVELQGLAPDERTLEEAVRVASGVPGVRSVTSNLAYAGVERTERAAVAR
jgi:hypothetical protein